MSQNTRDIAKTWFETGDTPTQQQFSDLLDSIVWYDEPKEYCATFSQSGTAAPSPTVIKNSTDSLPSWAYVSAGVYTITGTFPTGKTLVTANNGSGAAVLHFFLAANQITILVAGNNILINAQVKIEVYP